MFGATKDTTPPTVSITNPKDSAVVSGVVTIKVDASDSGGIAKVEFYVGDSKVGEDSNKPYEYNWDTKKLKDGTYVLTVKATDSAGNKNSKSIKVIVNNTKVETWKKTFGEKYDDGANSIQQTKDGGYIVAGWTYSFGSGGEDVYILKLNAKGEVEWQKTFGGKYDDKANSIQQTTDDGYIVAGWTYSFGSGEKDVYTLKLNAKGEVEWQKTFGGKSDDGANSIQQTKDGGYIVAGWTSSFGLGRYDVYILKMNSKGEVEWQKTFGGEDSDGAFLIQQTPDGGYIVAGWTYSFNSVTKEIYILKLNSKGQLEWQKAFGGEDGDEANSIQQTKDGGYIVAGWTGDSESQEGDVYVLKLNSKGQVEWRKTFGGTKDDGANSIQQTKDGGYIVAGWTESFGSGEKDVYTLKLNAKGEVEWQKTFGGKYDDKANSIQQTKDGGYIVAGWTKSFGSGEEDVYILKLNSKGEVEWQKTFGKGSDDIANSIQQTGDDGYIIAGWTGLFGYVGNVYILKLNSKGEVEWKRTFGMLYNHEANSIQQTVDGGYIVAGWTYSFGSGCQDIYILKLNPKGEVEWDKTFGGESDDEAKSIQQTTDGGYIVAGWTASFGTGKTDVYILKLDSKGEIDVSSQVDIDAPLSDIKIISPSDGIALGGTIEINIDATDDVELEKVTLYIDGKKIREYTSGPYKYSWDSSKVKEGIHTITVEAVDKSGNVTTKSVTTIMDKIKDVSWQKTFGGWYDEWANSIQQTTDGGYIVGGWTRSFGSGEKDVYILKLNSRGEVEWQKTFGGEDGDEAKSIQQTTDGGYIVAGWTYSPDSKGDVCILKLNSKGEVEWQKTFGGKSDDGANSIQQTTDGGYIVAGWTNSFGSGEEDVYILKLNAKGEVQWQKTFGGKDDDVANSIQQTTDGGYIVAGWTKSFSSGKDVYILKLNAKGEDEWEKTFGGRYDDEANSIQQTTDGGYIVAGWTVSFGTGKTDVYILKLNAKGQVEWRKTFGVGYGAKSIQQTADGGYIVGDAYILKLNSKGQLEWRKAFGGGDGAKSIQQATDGGYIVAGWTYSSDSGEDFYILKLNSKGWVDTTPPEIKIISPSDGIALGGTIEINIDATDDVELEKVTLYIDGKKIREYTSGPYKYSWDSSKVKEGTHTITVEAVDKSGNVTTKSVTTIMDKIKDISWQKTFGGWYDEWANSIQQTTDGGYIVAGWTESFGSGERDVYILKLSPKGQLEWQKTFGGKSNDEANSTQQTTDGGYIVAGWTYSPDSRGDVYILKLNSKGEVEWQKTFGGAKNDVANSIQQTTDGGYIVAGWTESFGSGEEDAYILKLNSKGEIEWQKTFGGEVSDLANSIQQTTDGGYIVAGWTESFGSGWQDVYILKLNSKGEIEWQKAFGGKDDDEANSIQQTTDGGYIVAGWTGSFDSRDVYILKLSSKGEVEWQKIFGGRKNDEANSIQQTTDGGYIVAGWTYSSDSGEDFYILKLDSKGEVEE